MAQLYPEFRQGCVTGIVRKSKARPICFWIALQNTLTCLSGRNANDRLDLIEIFRYASVTFEIDDINTPTFRSGTRSGV